MDRMTLRDAMWQLHLCGPRICLENYRNRGTTVLPEEHWQHLSEQKQAAIRKHDQLTAKAVWCLETIGRIQDHFISAFAAMHSAEYKQAWDQLERCEIETIFLDKHFHEKEAEFGIEHARVYTGRFQSLYPFKWGFSPGILYKDVRCSVCDAKVTLRGGCKHIIGEIYDGEMCSRVIKKAELLHIALVDSPAQKYSVIFPNGDNDQRFILIKHVVTALRSPWDGWDYHKEERKKYHPAFKGIRRNDLCPCGSGLKYKRCCLNKETVFPHFELSFEKKPEIDLPPLEIYTEGNQ